MAQRPAGITVIAILVAVQGVLAILTGLEAAGIIGFGLGAAADTQASGLADIVIGLVTLVVSYGLFATQEWAWLIAMVITAMRIVTGALAVVLTGIGTGFGIAGAASVVIGLVILWYFLRRDVRGAFGR